MDSTDSTKVVISERFGGFGLSSAGEARLRDFGWDGTYDGDIARDDPRLVQVVEELGTAADGRYARLVIVEVPADVTWHVHEYDGSEEIHETHRVWSSGGAAVDCS